MSARTSSESAVMRRVVARHIHCALAAERNLDRDALDPQTINLVTGFARSARGLLAELEAAGVDLTVELAEVAS
ncbi:hypothetical protein KCMC57_64920 (plasmid) [Kitasatospora sp. CMC57]|uniref:Uncharacterized protein n=1 Tax=Kitasatospora sp. CMC57 TaxID=3231513 RepID=A0AB33K9H5_9ACTN